MTAAMIALVAPLAVGVAVALGFWQFYVPPTQTEELQERLARAHVVATAGGDLDAIELQKPLSERLWMPLVGGMGKFLARRTKESQLAQLRIKLARAGSLQRPETILAMQVIVPIVAGVGSYIMATALLHWHHPLDIIMPLALVFLGARYPTSNLQGKAKKRALAIRMALPGALDLLGVAMEAGLSLDAAMMRVAEGDTGVLNQEFGKVLGEIHLGRTRADALMAMAERNDVEEMGSFVRSIVQAEPLGVSISTVLTVQADELRRIRRQRAEEAGHRAPVLMLIPMMSCIFPCIFIILLGPAVIKVITGS